MTSPARVAEAIATISEITKDLGVVPRATVPEIAAAVVDLEISHERQPMDVTRPAAPAFDGARFLDAITAVRESKGIESDNKFAQVIGVNHSCFSRIRNGQGVEFETLLRIVAFTGLDLRRYVSTNGVPSHG